MAGATEGLARASGASGSSITRIPPTPFGKYTLVCRLGHGGSAEVFLAVAAGPAGFRKLVVIKRLLGHLTAEPGFVEMFLDEARLSARFSHPNVVQTFEVGEVGGVPFIAMDFLEGQPLDRIINRTLEQGLEIPFGLVCYVFAEALDGLGYAHELRDYNGVSLGVVHRDVSPHNLFVTYEGAVKLLDFGIAKASHRLVHTDTGTVKGKFAYMAPEQARCEPIDQRADLWSMGVVMWEVLSGQRLFKYDSEVATLAAVLNRPIPQLAELAPDVPRGLVAVVERAVERNADKRYQTAAEMRADIEAVAAREGWHEGRAKLASFMKETFSDHLGEHHALVGQWCEEGNAARDGEEPGGAPVSLATDAPTVRLEVLPTVRAAIDQDVPTVTGARPPAGDGEPTRTSIRVKAKEPEPQLARGSGRRVVVPLLLVVVVVAASILLAWHWGSSGPSGAGPAGRDAGSRGPGSAAAPGLPAGAPDGAAAPPALDAGAAADAASTAPVLEVHEGPREPARPHDAGRPRSGRTRPGDTPAAPPEPGPRLDIRTAR